MDMSSIISVNTVELNNIINQLVMMDIYSLLNPTIAECKFFSISQEIFTKRGNILCHKTHYNKSKREIIHLFLAAVELNYKSITENPKIFGD